MTLNHVRKNSGPRRTQRDSDFSRLIAAIIDKRGRKREQKKKKNNGRPSSLAHAADDVLDDVFTISWR